MSKWNNIRDMYVDKHLKIFPVKNNEKLPLINNWLNDCSDDYFQCLYWYNTTLCNWGLPANPNNLFILDLDVHDENKNGIKSFKNMLADILNIPIDFEIDDVIKTLIQQTPSGGLHIIFKSDNELSRIVNCSNAFTEYQGIDIRTSGFIVVYPSEINGKQYKFLNDVEPQEMPEKLKEFIINYKGLYKDSENKEPYKKPTSVECGDRDNQLFSYINNIYYKTGLDFDEVLVLANYFNENILEKPFPEKTVKYKVKKVFEKPRDSYIYIKLEE